MKNTIIYFCKLLLSLIYLTNINATFNNFNSFAVHIMHVNRNYNIVEVASSKNFIKNNCVNT